MELSYKIDSPENINSYDTEAKASAWFGPEVVFGLSFKYINTGEKIIDIGIRTGLCSFLYHKAGLRVYGIDISTEMLEVCRKKIPSAQLTNHDMLNKPYPYESKSMNYAICTGVMNFFKDLNVIFSEVSRIIQKSGIFGFIVADQKAGEDAEIKVSPEHTHSEAFLTMYWHTQKQIEALSRKHGFIIRRSLEYPVFMDREKRKKLRAKAYIVEKG